MWFRNLVVHRLPAGWSASPAELEDALARRRLQPCAPLEMMSRGWLPPSGSGAYVHVVGRQLLLALGVDQRLLPASVIRQAVQERAAGLAEEQGFPVGRRQLRELKLRVADELRPRAFVRRRVTRAWLDPDGGWFVVDAAAAPRAEELVETLRETLGGSFPVERLDTAHAPRLAMTSWLRQGDAPARFAIDAELALQGTPPQKPAVRYARHALDGALVARHLQAGLQPVKLGLTWADRVSFVLTDGLALNRVELLDVDEDRPSEDETDAVARLDADFLLMTGELSTLLKELVDALGGEAARAEAA